MNLKFHLLIRIILVAIICLLATAAYVLYNTDQQSKQQSQIILDSITRQLEVQLFRIDAGFGRRDLFPDLSLWKETHSVSGICIRFQSANNKITRGICRGSEWPNKHWPKLFETVYQFIFTPGLEVFRPIIFNNQVYGSITVIPSVEMELNLAWTNMRALLGLSAITILSICTLVYLSISRALHPALIIASKLDNMQKGELTVHFPPFELLEWQRISTAINELTIRQQQLLSDRTKLTFKLITLQDDERLYLARELHDELGQCLAAINALSASITQTAQKDCLSIVKDAESIARINGHMMDQVQNLLIKLRPAEIDELGFELSLKNLISEWTGFSSHKIHYQLVIKGNCQQLPTPYPITLFRIIQECLSNISKHSSATSAIVKLEIKNKLIVLSIEDNGNMKTLPLSNNSGFGLLGIRERASALGGQMSIKKSELGGLGIKVILPLNFIRNIKHDN